MTLIGLAPDEVHEDNFHNRGTRVFIIEIGQSWMERVLEHITLFDESVDFRGGLVPWLALRLYNEFQQEDQLSLLSIEGLTLELIAETARHYSRPPELRPSRWLIQVKELLHERFSETLTLEKIAKTVEIHPVHLARGFLRRRRIEFASGELMMCDVPLSQIALRAGFYDQSHFSRVFKRLMGLTPA
jgi:AraC family transcriptional regulator